MEQYIPKSALVAEIEKKKIPFKKDIDNGIYPTYLCALMDFEDFIDTLEVKEVDLEEEICTFFSKNPIPYEHITDWPLLKNCAIHFFELGLRASQPTTSVYGIEEALKENGIDPDSKEADIYREAIYKIYDRLQAQKG